MSRLMAEVIAVNKHDLGVLLSLVGFGSSCVAIGLTFGGRS